jgi:membrane protease YdiL (CAAX protease family)
LLEEPKNVAQGSAASSTGPGPSRRTQVIEVLVFLSLILPAMGSAYFTLGSAKVSFAGAAVSAILSDLGLVALLLYFVWRNAEPWSRIGWTMADPSRETVLGIVLFFPMGLIAHFVELAARSAGLGAPTKLPSFLHVSGPAGIVLGIVLVTVVAVAEETIFRGYLILRFKAATGGTGIAVVLSTILFACGHGYEGLAGMVAVFSIGLMLAGVYLWRGSLVAPIVMHFLQDFSGLLLPMLRAQ